jgi:hypothetical protein
LEKRAAKRSTARFVPRAAEAIGRRPPFSRARLGRLAAPPPFRRSCAQAETGSLGSVVVDESLRLM